MARCCDGDTAFTSANVKTLSMYYMSNLRLKLVFPKNTLSTIISTFFDSNVILTITTQNKAQREKSAELLQIICLLTVLI